MYNAKCLNILDIPWEDILITKVLPELSLTDCCNLRKTSLDFEKLVDVYFRTMKQILQTDAKFLKSSDLLVLATRTGNLEKINLNASKLTDEAADQFLRNNTSLTHVNFSNTQLKDTTLWSMIYCVGMKQLILAGCQWLTNECLLTLKAYLPKLEFVKVTFCPQLDIVMLASQFRRPILPSLRRFEVSVDKPRMPHYSYVWNMFEDDIWEQDNEDWFTT